MNGRIKPLEGQRSLFPGVPDVRYCRACGLRLHSHRSIERGYGPTCWRRRPLETDEQGRHHGDEETGTGPAGLGLDD